MKDKNRDQDRWYSRMRAPYEWVFSQRNRRGGYREISKNQLALFMNTMSFNLKRIRVLAPSDFVLV